MGTGQAESCFRYVAFGLRWESDFAIPAFATDRDQTLAADIKVSMIQGPPPERLGIAPQSPVRSKTSGNGIAHFAADGFRVVDSEVATIDVFGHHHVALHPGPRWQSKPPVPLTGIVPAFMLARRGFLPIHGTAVCLENRAILICGPSGSGKSTTAARLIAQGARLISDDLSVLCVGHPADPPRLFAGRRAMRLHPDTAEWLGRKVPAQSASHLVDGKVAFYPPLVEPTTSIALARVILLGHPAGPVPLPARARLLGEQLFRPRYLCKMHGHLQRQAMLAFVARTVEVDGSPELLITGTEPGMSGHDGGG